MTDKISEQDWENLSAYLDGQLSGKDQQQLESKLERSADLRQALQELRRTRILLKSQPRLRSPRNFTLTAQMIGRKDAARPAPVAFPVLRFASVIASILLVIVLAGDWFTSSRPALMLGAQAPAAEMRMDLMQAQTETPAAVQAPPAESEMTQASEQPQMKAMTVPENTPFPDGTLGPMEAPAPADDANPELMLQAAAPAGESQELQSEVTPTAELLTGESLAEAAPPPASRQANQVEEAPAPEAVVQPTRWIWRATEIVLAITALLTGILAFTLVRGRRDRLGK